MINCFSHFRDSESICQSNQLVTVDNIPHTQSNCFTLQTSRSSFNLHWSPISTSFRKCYRLNSLEISLLIFLAYGQMLVAAELTLLVDFAIIYLLLKQPLIFLKTQFTQCCTSYSCLDRVLSSPKHGSTSQAHRLKM